MDPYQSPASDPIPTFGSRSDCPACGSPLASGEVSGNLFWHEARESLRDTLLGGLQVFGARSFKITLRKERRPAQFCRSCGTVIVLPEES
ncbi:MAG: PF20097 family protein [Akkermansiaceae bacterium]|nr:PF20097 family protein [Akkermansiaceae bacterium]